MENTQLLSSQEMRDHQEDEAIIERGLKSFYEVGSALLRIRERRSYRDKFKTFEDYCRVRWDMSRVHAKRLVHSTVVIDNIKTEPIGSLLPATESQWWPLTTLDTPEQQQEAWKRALEVAEREGRNYVNKKIRAAEVVDDVDHGLQSITSERVADLGTMVPIPDSERMADLGPIGPIPELESQARPITTLESKEQRHINQKIAAAAVRENLSAMADILPTSEW